jgi:hypothetical protein
LAIVSSAWAANDDAETTSFQSALAKARANVATAEGEKFDMDFGMQFGERYVNTLTRCTEGVAEADLGEFDLLVRLSAQGKPEEILVEPATSVATCLSKDVRKGQFIKPPRESYWVRVEMRLTP